MHRNQIMLNIHRKKTIFQILHFSTKEQMKNHLPTICMPKMRSHNYRIAKLYVCIKGKKKKVNLQLA